MDHAEIMLKPPVRPHRYLLDRSAGLGKQGGGRAGVRYLSYDKFRMEKSETREDHTED